MAKLGKLGKVITCHGMTSKQLKRKKSQNGSDYILAELYSKDEDHDKEKIIGYEVFKVMVRTARSITNSDTGKVSDVEAHEAKPSPEDWGKFGWTLRTLDRAQEKFEECLSFHPRGVK